MVQSLTTAPYFGRRGELFRFVVVAHVMLRSRAPHPPSCMVVLARTRAWYGLLNNVFFGHGGVEGHTLDAVRLASR